MSRVFAVIGFTLFFTISMLYKFETGVTVAVLAVFSVALVLALLVKDFRRQKVIPCSLISAVLACLLLLSTYQFSYLPAIQYNDQICDIKATLVSEPEYEYGNCYYIARISEINGESVDLKTRLVFSSVPDAEAYDVVTGNFKFYIPGSTNDITLQLNKANGIYIAAYPYEQEFYITNIPESEKPFGKIIINIRNAIKESVYRILPNEYGGLAVALIIGDKTGLSDNTLDSFSFLGISHVICVSGYHLSLWSMFVYELLRKTRMNPRIAAAISSAVVVLLMFISGMTYSVIRSGIMLLLFFIAKVLFRNSDSLNSLGFALVLFAIFNTYSIGSVSLQLSVLSTTGIILYGMFFSPYINEKMKSIKIKFLSKNIEKLLNAFMVTLSATAFTLPVSLTLYNMFNFSIFAANIVVVPLSGICMILCVIGAIIGCFSTSVINLPGYFGGLISKFIIDFSTEFSKFKKLSFYIEKEETAIIIISLFMIISFALILAYYGRSYPKLVSIICSAVFVFELVMFSTFDKHYLKINVIDCGNGTSVILNKNDETVLVGCGGSEFLGEYKIGYALSDSGNTLKAIIFPDSDDNSASYLKKIIPDLNPESVYCDSVPDGSELLFKNSEIHNFENKITFDNFTIENKNIEGKAVSYIETEDACILILFDPLADYSSIPDEFSEADVIICRNDYPSGIENSDSDFVITNTENTRGFILQNELKDKGVKSAATAGCGNIIVEAEDGYISSYRDH